MPDTAYLGIDIAKRKFDVALARPDGPVRVKACPNTRAGYTELVAWVARQHPGAVHACLEATGPYGEPVAEALADAGYTVSVVNPAMIEAYARSRLTRTKTDRVDARLIAQFCATQQPPAWAPLPREVRTLQAFVRRLDALEGMRTQERNRLAAEPADAVIRASIQHVIDLLEDEMATLRARIRDHFDQHPDLRAQRDLLTSIPGIGEATAAVLLAEFGPLTRFRQAPACAAFAGLVPRHGESGQLRPSQTGALEARRAGVAQSALLSGDGRLATQPASSPLSASACAPKANTRWWSSPPPCASSRISRLGSSKPDNPSTPIT